MSLNANISEYFTKANSLLTSIDGYLQNIWYYFYPPEWNGTLSYSWKNFWSSFEFSSFSEVLKDTLLEVQKEIDNSVNPLSEDNKDNYNSAVDNLKNNTFVGSAYDVIKVFPDNLNSALTKDSRSVLTFSSSGVSNSYFTLPAHSYSIDFGWYKPYKAYADVVISAFIYLGFAFAFFKRLPEIIQGAGVVYAQGQEFKESMDFISEYNLDEAFSEPSESYSVYYGAKWEEV